MTTSNWKKAFTQLDAKPAVKRKYVKHNKPLVRAHGKATRSCRVCGSHTAHIDKYGLDLCRKCFRQFATELGFKKFR